MGCSPSKGKLFTKPGPQNGQLVEEPQDHDSRPTDTVKQRLKSEEKELLLPTAGHITSEPAWVSSDETDTTNATETEETEGKGVMPKEIVTEVLKTDEIKRTQRSKKNKVNRKQRKSSIIKTKVDFPPHIVRAHQAAYAFLNPNISKFETLLGLLDQAAQTQLSLQPMMSALVLRFEEINQALEEMAEEGELMLKEHGDYMALPSGMMGPAFMALKANTETSGPPDPPPDLLQQLLQHSTEKMRHVGTSFQALGDNTLEDAVEYFTSLSKLLVGKMQDKQVAEQRIAQVLARVEQATTRKSNPEDSALHSEDSGIGGENESLTGSERHRRHRGSAGSGSCCSGITIRGVLDNQPSNSVNLVDHNEYDEGDEEEEEEEDDDDENVDDEDGRQGRKRSNSSPPDPSQTLLYMHVKYMRDLMPVAKRPLTAANKPEALSAARSVNSVMELRKSQKDLEGRMKKIQGNREIEGPHYNLYRAGLRRHSISGSGGAHKEPLKTNQLCTLPVLAPQTPKRPSVRRLINTFSQGVDGRPGQSLVNIPPHIKRPRKSGVLLLSNIGNSTEGLQVNNGNNNNNSWPDGKDDLDVDNLPPPAPEVLMDNSFQDTEGNPANDNVSQEDVVQGLPIINQKCGLSHRLRTSMQNMEVLPNRASVRSRSTISSVSPVRQDAQEEERQESVLGQETEKTSCLYQQARKIIPLHHATESVEKRQTLEQSGQRGPFPLQCSTELHEGDMSRSSPVTAPPVSRVRLPPSCPSVRHRFPSPPVCRHQSSSSRPSSRPSSPRAVTRASDSTAEEIILSVSFHDARSVFCQNETQNSQSWTSSGVSVLPRPRGDIFRGRLSTRGMENSSRRTQSEQRPSLTSHSEDGHTGSTQAMWKEQITTNQSSVTAQDDSQLNQSAAVTTRWD